MGKKIEKWLIHQGFTVICIAKENASMSDAEILKLAEIESAIIITMDKDFGELVYKHKAFHNGVLLLRLEDAYAEEKLAALENIFPEHLQKLEKHFSVYQNGKLRIR